MKLRLLKPLVWLGLICLFASGSLLIAQVGPNESLDAKLNRNTGTYRLAANSFIEALVKVSSDFKIPVLIEWVNAPSSKEPVAYNWTNSTVREVLEQVLRTQPNYGLRITNGVAHIETGGVASGQNFLALKIKGFEVNDEPVETASRKLRDEVEFTVSPRVPSQSSGGIGTSFAANAGEPKITLNLQNATVEEILDQFVSNSARKICIVTFLDSFMLTPTGFRRTETLWNMSSALDRQQAVWDMFHWGDHVPAIKTGSQLK